MVISSSHRHVPFKFFVCSPGFLHSINPVGHIPVFLSVCLLVCLRVRMYPCPLSFSLSLTALYRRETAGMNSTVETAFAVYIGDDYSCFSPSPFVGTSSAQASPRLTVPLSQYYILLHCSLFRAFAFLAPLFLRLMSRGCPSISLSLSPSLSLALSSLDCISLSLSSYL